MEAKIISQEYIKPSSPTPPHLKTHKLSLLDQFIPSIYIPMILFYPMNHSTSDSVVDILSERSHLLKQSLSEILTRFYPFAGKIKDNLSIDCNDEGILYLEGQVDCHLVDYLNQPSVGSLQKLIPREAAWKEAVAGDHIAMIKVTTFACGGVGIGVLVCHMIADGTAFSVFLKGWAAMARKACESVCPNFDSPSIFIQNDAYHKEAGTTASSKHFKSGKHLVRRIVFDASAIASLKTKASSSSVQHPTKVEVVSALLWKCAMTAFKATSGIQRPTFITHLVNLRRRADPQFTESSMGNFLWTAGAFRKGEEIDLLYLVRKLREEFMKINANLVRNLQGEGGFFKLSEHVKEITGVISNMDAMDYISFTSWCNFGFYDIDFGWGKPMWVSCVGSSGDLGTLFSSSIVLMDTRSGDGVEAWVALNTKNMTTLVQDKELLAFASVDPSPLG